MKNIRKDREKNIKKPHEIILANYGDPRTVGSQKFMFSMGK